MTFIIRVFVLDDFGRYFFSVVNGTIFSSFAAARLCGGWLGERFGMRILISVLLVGLSFNCTWAQIQDNEIPVLITLDHNDDYVLTGIGQRLLGVNFQGPVGAFETAVGSPLTQNEAGQWVGESPAPFDILLLGSSDWVSYGSLGAVEVNGSFPLQFGPTDVSLQDQIRIQVGFEGNSTPVDTQFGFICDFCDYPSAVVTADGGIEVTNVNDPIIRVSIFSNTGGLESVTEVPAGVTVVEASSTEVTLEKLDGFDPMSLQSLEFFSGVSSSQPVFVEFGLEGGGQLGPMPVARAVPEPSGLLPLILGGLLCLTRRRSRKA